MISTDGGEHRRREPRRGEDVGGVQRAADANLHHGVRHAAISESRERARGERLEIGDSAALGDVRGERGVGVRFGNDAVSGSRGRVARAASDALADGVHVG